MGKRTVLFTVCAYPKQPLALAQIQNTFVNEKWSWRESNPRPHEETIRFLHAYSRLGFRAVARPGPPTATLSPKISPTHRSLRRLFPILLRRWTREIRDYIPGATSRPVTL